MKILVVDDNTEDRRLLRYLNKKTAMQSLRPGTVRRAW